MPQNIIALKNNMPIPYFKKTARWSAGSRSSSQARVKKIVIKARPLGGPRHGQTRKNKSLWRRFVRTKFFRFLALLALVCFIGVAAYVFMISRQLPEPGQLMNREIPQSTTIYDRSGEFTFGYSIGVPMWWNGPLP